MNLRQTATNSESHYPDYQSVVQDLQSRRLRYVSLLALADTSVTTEEWACYSNAADQMAKDDPNLPNTPYLAAWVARLADQYRAEEEDR